MAFQIELETGFEADVDGTPVVGRCRILSAAQRLAYSSAHTRAQADDSIGDVIALVDQWVGKVLVKCDATVDGNTYEDLAEDVQTVYVEHLPMDAKSAIITQALGLSGLNTDGPEGNDFAPGPSSG